jgi:hypothetical protein
MPDVRDKLIGLGIDPVGSSSAEFRAFLTQETERFAKMFSISGLSPE